MSQSENMNSDQSQEQEGLRPNGEDPSGATAADSPAMSTTGQPAESVPPAPELPRLTCDECGLLEPGVPVYQCSLCMKSVCVKHLDATRHSCYGGST